MALIVYPDLDWDTFASELRADEIIGGFVASNGKAAFEALDSLGKEAILRQTALQIKLCPNITLPATLENDLEVAQCYLVTYALTVDMLAFDSNDRAISEEHAGEVGVSYDTSKKASNNAAFDPMTSALLKQYGCKNSTGTFSQSYMGKS